MNHILIVSTSEEGTPKSNARNTIQGRLLSTLRESNTILTESNETLICSKSREDTAEFSGAARFSNCCPANQTKKVKVFVMTLHMNHGGFECHI